MEIPYNLTVLVGANAQVGIQLAEWDAKINEYINLLYQGEIERTRGTKFGDCIAKTGYLLQRAYEEPLLFRGLIDNNGRLQCGAIIEDDAGYIYLYENYRQYVYLETICSAPWNVIDNQPETLKGSATFLVEEIVKECMEMGYNGVVKTLSIPRAKPFYERIGFSENPDGSGEWVLTEESAYDFLRQQQQFRLDNN